MKSGFTKALQALLPGQPGKPAKRRRKAVIEGVLLVSFPKSGRTWVRVMLDRLGLHLTYSHDDSDHSKQVPFPALDHDKSRYRESRVTFLLRDPRDVVVSGYFQAAKRLGLYEGTISDFIRDERHGIEKIVRFNQAWLAARSQPKDFLLLKYEDFHADAARELQKIVRFLDVGGITEEDLAATVRHAKFENMKRLERSGGFDGTYGDILRPADPDDPESFKTRKGKVGGYSDYLSAEDIAFCDRVLKRLDYWRLVREADG
jgi:hypothetical protein